MLDNDKFITVIQNFPSLWDKIDFDYADKVKRANV